MTTAFDYLEMDRDSTECEAENMFLIVADGLGTPIRKRKYPRILVSGPTPKAACTESAIQEKSGLCSRCRAIPFYSLLSNTPLSYRGNFVTELARSVDILKGSSCPLCQLFYSMVPDESNENGWYRGNACQLWTFSAKRALQWSCDRDRSIPDTTILGVVRAAAGSADSYDAISFVDMRWSLQEKGYLALVQIPNQTQVFRPRLICPESFNADFALDCICYCQAHHGLPCNVPTTEEPVHFRVIDCKRTMIVSAPPRCHYVALSYVWGQGAANVGPNSSEEPSHADFEGLPKVIRDAMAVTLRLGYQYLWVDRLCINHLDQDIKHDQILQMDLVYSQAQVTIIAAADDGPFFGLPGVRGTVRKPQPNATVTGHSITSTLPHPSWSVQKSKWASRGWTYQEGILSKRRLVFTEEQILFECNGMHCVESIIIPLDELHRDDKTGFKEEESSGAFAYTSPGSNPCNIMGYVAEYNKRDLTYATDRLIAFQGIFRAFGKGSTPFYTCLGVPVMLMLEHPNVELAHNYRKLPNVSKKCFLLGLSWYHTKPGVRYPAFPSWTWAGWSNCGGLGKLAHDFIMGEEALPGLNEPKLWLEERDGGLVIFPSLDYLRDILPKLEYNLRYIHIEAWTVRLSLCRFLKEAVLLERRQYINQPVGRGRRLDQEDIYYAVFSDSSDRDLFVRFYPDQEWVGLDLVGASSSGKLWTGILLGDLRQLGVMVVEEKDGYAERVGFASFRYCGLRIGSYWTELWDLESKLSWWWNHLPKRRRTMRLG